MTLKSKDRSWAVRLHLLLCWLNLHFWIVRKQSDKNPRRKECVVCGETETLPTLAQRNRNKESNEDRLRRLNVCCTTFEANKTVHHAYCLTNGPRGITDMALIRYGVNPHYGDRGQKTPVNVVEPPTMDEMMDEPDTNPKNEMVGGDL